MAACWVGTNYGANSMRTFETLAANDVKAGLVVEYHATPVYRTATSTVPEGFQLAFWAETLSGLYVDAESAYIANDNNGKLPNLGN